MGTAYRGTGLTRTWGTQNFRPQIDSMGSVPTAIPFTADCARRTAYCVLRTSTVLRTENIFVQNCLRCTMLLLALRTAYCVLRAAYCVLKIYSFRNAHVTQSNKTKYYSVKAV